MTTTSRLRNGLRFWNDWSKKFEEYVQGHPVSLSSWIRRIIWLQGRTDERKWLVECRDLDFVEISGAKAENRSSKLHNNTRATAAGYKTANRPL